jgi:hypothetical protein
MITHGGDVIFVWGCMTSHGVGYMCKIEMKMTQALYLIILVCLSCKQLNGTVSTLLVSYFNMIMIPNILQN